LNRYDAASGRRVTDMQRREVFGVVGGAAAWPVAARAQAAISVIGLLLSGSPEDEAFRVDAVRPLEKFN